MMDIVELLREQWDDGPVDLIDLCEMAADEIELLRVEMAQLREQLRVPIRAALGEKP
jgi:hypothetical protein